MAIQITQQGTQMKIILAFLFGVTAGYLENPVLIGAFIGGVLIAQIQDWIEND